MQTGTLVRSCRALLLSACLALVVGCNNPRVFVLHSPMQPTNAQTVTYTATATDSDRIRSIEIWEDRNTLGSCANGMHCATRVSTSRLTTCTINPPQTPATCTFTTAGGYPDGSFIGYRAVATDTKGDSGSEGWIYFAAGAYPWPNDPIPIYGTGAPAEKIDLVFIPDTDYGGNNNQFVQDVSGLVANGYLSNQPFASHIRLWRGYWQFYVTYQTGDARGYGNGCNQAPANWGTLTALVDGGAIVHVNNLRDCGQRPPNGLFSTMPGANQTTIHETGHTIFDLADEYCCDGGYWQTSPHPNLLPSQATCQANATSEGWPTGDCVQLRSPSCGGGMNSTWWRSDRNNDLMECGAVYGRADQSRIYWMYFDQCSGTNGC